MYKNIHDLAKSWGFKRALTMCEACEQEAECAKLDFFDREGEQTQHWMCFQCHEDGTPIASLTDEEMGPA